MCLILLFEPKITFLILKFIGWDEKDQKVMVLFLFPGKSLKSGTGVDPSGLKPRRVMKMPLEDGREDRDLQPVEVQEAKDAEVILPKPTRFF